MILLTLKILLEYFYLHAHLYLIYMLNRYNSEPGAKFPTNPTVKSRPAFKVSTNSLKSTANNIAMEQTARRTNRLSDAVKGK